MKLYRVAWKDEKSGLLISQWYLDLGSASDKCGQLLRAEATGSVEITVHSPEMHEDDILALLNFYGTGSHS